MNKSKISYIAENIDPAIRPFGFIYVQKRPSGNRRSFFGCIELKDGDTSTSFYFRIYNFDSKKREYECAFSQNGEFDSPFITAVVYFVDDDPQTTIKEFFKFNPDLVNTKDMFVDILHKVAINFIIKTTERLENEGSIKDRWINCIGEPGRDDIQEGVKMNLGDIISTTNLLLP